MHSRLLMLFFLKQFVSLQSHVCAYPLTWLSLSRLLIRYIPLQSSSMSKRRSSEKGAGETSGRASKLQCPGISGNNAKRAGPFILGEEATTVYTSPKSIKMIVESLRLYMVCDFSLACVTCVHVQEMRKYMCICVWLHKRVVGYPLCALTPETRMWRILLIPMTSARKVRDCVGARLFIPSGEYFSPILSNLDIFYSTTPQLFAMQSAKENITLGVLMGTCTCSL